VGVEILDQQLMDGCLKPATEGYVLFYRLPRRAGSFILSAI